MADGADWKYYKEKCKVLLICSQENCVFPYDYIMDASALAPDSHRSCFPALPLAGFASRTSCCLCCPPVPRDLPVPPLVLVDFLPGSAGDRPPFHSSAVQALTPNRC